jgi:hypothetical protein
LAHRCALLALERGLERGGVGSTMLSGFNTNFRHRGVLFHVQTEDSGKANPHVITHLFYGGNILASEKQTYAAQLDSEDLETVVRELMESQHKTMLKRLKRGMHDPVILERLGAQAFNDDKSGSTTDAQLVSEVASPSTSTTAPVSPRASETSQSLAPSPNPGLAETPKERLARAFGEGVVSRKPLDEVVLDYLVENARKRKRPSK